MIRIGDKVRDSMTRFEGTVFARCEYATMPPRVGIVPRNLTNDGEPGEVWLDEARVFVAPREELQQAATARRPVADTDLLRCTGAVPFL